VPASWATSLETPTLHRTVDPQGRKRLILFSGLYPIRMAHSEDDGRTWSELAPIGNYGGIVAMSSLVRLRDGRYLAFFHDDGRFFRQNGRSGPFVVYTVSSADGGLTWSEPRAIATHAEAHLCEPGVFRSPDGRQLAMLLRENSRRFHSFITFSNDEGATWSEPRELPAALTGDRHQGAYTRDGRLFLTFRDTAPASPTRGDWVGWLGRYEDLVSGAPGQYRVHLLKNHKDLDCCYPGVEVLPNGEILTTTYGHWTPGEPPYVVALRFHPKVLDRAAKRRP